GSHPICYSKIVLYGELHDARLHVGLDLTKRAAVERRVGGAAGDPDRTGIQEIGAVLDVEGFGADFEVLLLLDPELARQRNVNVEVTGTFQVVVAKVAERTGGRRSECVHAHPAVD